MQSKRSRGFGFVTFVSQESAQKCLREQHTIRGKAVELKVAIPREIIGSPRNKRRMRSGHYQQQQQQHPQQHAKVLSLPNTAPPSIHPSIHPSKKIFTTAYAYNSTMEVGLTIYTPPLEQCHTVMAICCRQPPQSCPRHF